MTTAPSTDAATTGVARLVHQLTVVGWLLLGGESGFILSQLQRVRTVDGTRFSTAWGQRIETLSFLILPPNQAVLVPAVAAVVMAVILETGERSPWLDALLRTIAAISITFVAVGFVSIMEVGSRAGDLEIGSIFLQLGGMAMAAGIAVLCRVADTTDVGEIRPAFGRSGN